ncbi:hypothetical protein LUU34_00841300 [Aix galericulata]|nr:hypothetical protein LUU34_00841300 [Aix galericulata]
METKPPRRHPAPRASLSSLTGHGEAQQQQQGQDQPSSVPGHVQEGGSDAPPPQKKASSEPSPQHCAVRAPFAGQRQSIQVSAFIPQVVAGKGVSTPRGHSLGWVRCPAGTHGGQRDPQHPGAIPQHPWGRAGHGGGFGASGDPMGGTRLGLGAGTAAPGRCMARRPRPLSSSPAHFSLAPPLVV